MKNNRLKDLFNKAGRTILRSLSRPARLRMMEQHFDSGLPYQMRAALEFLVTGKLDGATRVVVERAEGRRSCIACRRNEEVSIWYSPTPGSTDTTNDTIRPKPGKELRFTMAQIAKTGKDKRWGTALYLIASGFNSKIAVELGTCAGISAIYLASAKSVQRLVTVEGSKDLADLAKESLKPYQNTKVIHGLFDDAIDSAIRNLNAKIDLAYIDGHHEQVATIYYFNRLLPLLQDGAVVIFDDISWSHDMREAWDKLKRRSELRHSIDLGAIGVVVLKSTLDETHQEPEIWNMQPIVGRPEIGIPHGWSESGSVPTA